MAKHMDSYDFSTLYTSIPHDSLKNNMNILIYEAFKVRDSQYLSCNNKMNCYWTQSRNSNISIDKTELKAMVEYLVNNVFGAGG